MLVSLPAVPAKLVAVAPFRAQSIHQPLRRPWHGILSSPVMRPEKPENRNAAVTTSRLGADHRVRRGHLVLQRENGSVSALQGDPVRAAPGQFKGDARRGLARDRAHESSGPATGKRRLAQRHDADDRVVGRSVPGATGDSERSGAALHVEARRRLCRRMVLARGTVLAVETDRVTQASDAPHRSRSALGLPDAQVARGLVLRPSSDGDLSLR